VIGLHHVQLAMPADSEVAAVAFYGGVLGFQQVPKPAALAGRGGVWFRSGGLELHLGVEDEHRPSAKAHPALLVEELEDLRARLAASGHEAIDDVDLPGFRRCHVRDPFGNRLELLEAIA
jgi:catechol 2,3-dioxygenase-like lactoylglutathione lyase family enzyme